MAWSLSLAGHAAALGLGLWLVERGVMAPRPEPERMVYIEPAAAPPPLGASLNAPRAPVAPQPASERLKDIPKPRRLVAPHKSKRVVLPSPVPAAAPRGEPEGSVGGVAGGVVGGQLGGVVGGRGDAPIPAARVEHPPILIARVLPVYPLAARARGVQGRVVLRAVVGRDGHVEEGITVVKSVAMFDTAAVAALRQWRFEPGRDRNGKPVRVLIEVPIRFQLR